MLPASSQNNSQSGVTVSRMSLRHLRPAIYSLVMVRAVLVTTSRTACFILAGFLLASQRAGRYQSRGRKVQCAYLCMSPIQLIRFSVAPATNTYLPQVNVVLVLRWVVR